MHQNPKPKSSEMMSMGSGVMLQACYWNDFWMIADDGNWWNTVKKYLPEIQTTGFDAIWLPPAQKTNIGNIARMGYEPYDYYDLGEYNQKGSIKTRYGSRTELTQFITAANTLNLAVVADIVINHNNGGELEYNTFTSTETPTNFMNIASGQFPRNYTHFHPCAYEESDAMAFGSLVDLCHLNPYVHDELIKYGEWLRDEIGFDGWRFDVANGIRSFMLEDWIKNVTGWGVAEYMTGENLQAADILNYLTETEFSLKGFDFPLLYEMRKMITLNGTYDMRRLNHAGLLGLRPDLAVTFVVNHDTQRTSFASFPKHQEMGYAYILIHEGYPMVYWDDYFNVQLRNDIIGLMQIRELYARGSTNVVYTDDDLYIMERSGDSDSPGLLLGLNDNPVEWKEASIICQWPNQILYDATNLTENLVSDITGAITIRIPPLSYVIYTPNLPIYTQILRDEGVDCPSPTRLNNQTIQIDGTFDLAWMNPAFCDRLGDASYKQYDLSHLFLSQNNTHLNIGFSYGKGLTSMGPIHFGIALDTQTGGNRSDPGLHQNIKWVGKTIPDHYLYVIMDSPENSLVEYDYYNFFSVGGNNWVNKTLSSHIQVNSDAQFGFMEIAIPFDDLALNSNQNISLKVFSTVDTRLGAMDSVPNDLYTNPSIDIESWLTLPAAFSVLIPPSDFTNTETNKNGTTPFEIYGYLFVGLISCITCYVLIKHHRKLHR